MIPTMVEDRIRNIETRVQASANLPDSAKEELLELLVALRAELRGVEKERLERAEEASARDAAAHAKSESLDDALGGLTATVTGLEATHPRLAELANRLALALGNMGI